MPRVTNPWTELDEKLAAVLSGPGGPDVAWFLVLTEMGDSDGAGHQSLEEDTTNVMPPRGGAAGAATGSQRL